MGQIDHAQETFAAAKKRSYHVRSIGSTCYNTWTTLDENSDGGDDAGVEEADDDGSADEQQG